jgi:phosphoglycolate phosphatase-like HAD superfamily hydrolase
MTPIALRVGVDVGAVVLDCDGVLLESVRCKGNAFRRLFAAWPEHVDEIEAFHYANGGMSRFEKLERIYADILHQALNDQTRAQLAESFARIVYAEILACPVVDGVRELLEQLAPVVPLFVASATPEMELRQILAARDMAQYFKRVFGYPTRKSDALRAVVRSSEGLRPDQVLFIGDAQADADAANEVGCRFIGRSHADGSNAFAGMPVPVVPDCAAVARLLTAT